MADQAARRQALRIVAIGSSSTYGIGASSPTHAYPAVLEALLREQAPRLEIDVMNLGVSGELTKQAAERIGFDIVRQRPTLLIWQVGTSDGVSGTPVAEFEATLHQTLKQLRSERIDVLLVGMQWTRRLEESWHYKEISEALDRVATSESVPLVRRFEAMKARTQARGAEDMLSADGFHLNDFGYRCMAEHIATAILSRLPTSRATTVKR